MSSAASVLDKMEPNNDSDIEDESKQNLELEKVGQRQEETLPTTQPPTVDSSGNTGAAATDEDQASKLGFSIAQIMGFMGAGERNKKKPDLNQSAMAQVVVNNDHHHPPKLWRPQPFRDLAAHPASR